MGAAGAQLLCARRGRSSGHRVRRARGMVGREWRELRPDPHAVWHPLGANHPGGRERAALRGGPVVDGCPTPRNPPPRLCPADWAAGSPVRISAHPSTMNICMMTNTYLPHVGGVARSVSTFAEQYHRKKHAVLV